MKNLVIVTFIALIILSSFVIANETAQANQTPQIPNAQTLNDIGAKSNDILSSDVKIPAGLENVINFVFGIKSEQGMSLESGIILVALWFFALIFMVSLVSFIPVFAEGFAKWVAAVVIMFLISISGGLYQGALFILGLADMFSFTSKYKMIGVFLALVVVAVLGWGLTKILGKFKNAGEEEKAEQSGVKVGIGAGIAKKNVPGL